MQKNIILPLLLVAVLSHATHYKTEGNKGWSKDDIFFWGMVSGGFVSMIGFIAAFLLLLFEKVISKEIYSIIIQIFFAFSCGALLG